MFVEQEGCSLVQVSTSLPSSCSLSIQVGVGAKGCGCLVADSTTLRAKDKRSKYCTPWARKKTIDAIHRARENAAGTPSTRHLWQDAARVRCRQSSQFLEVYELPGVTKCSNEKFRIERRQSAAFNGTGFSIVEMNSGSAQTYLYRIYLGVQSFRNQ